MHAYTKLGQEVRNKLSLIKTLFEFIDIFLNSEERVRDFVLVHIRASNNISQGALSDLKWIAAEASHVPLQQKLPEFDPIMDKFKEFLSEIDESVRLGRAKALQVILQKEASLIEETILLAENEEEI